MAEENEPAEGNEPTVEPKTEPATEPPAEPAGEGNVVDKHGQPGINKERHEKEVAELNKQIEELKATIAESAKAEESRKEMAAKIADLETKIADNEVTHKLESAGCKSVKAAKALLDDHDNDIEKLKEAEPWLFGKEKQTGSTGLPPAGAPNDADEQLRKAREAAKVRK